MGRPWLAPDPQALRNAGAGGGIRPAARPQWRRRSARKNGWSDVDEVQVKDVLAVAVPHSPKFAELAVRWRQAPLVRRFGIRILTVDQSGGVTGFEGPQNYELQEPTSGASQAMDAARS